MNELECHLFFITLIRDKYHLHNINKRYVSLNNINIDGNMIVHLEDFYTSKVVEEWIFLTWTFNIKVLKNK
jgi:hypothetical protein